MDGLRLVRLITVSESACERDAALRPAPKWPSEFFP